jgi:lipoprotein-releasing system permease protein
MCLNAAMFRPLPLALGWRYLRVRRRTRFVSVVALVAVLGVALGVAALIVVLSVMNGMADALTGQILAVTPQVTISAPPGQSLSGAPGLARTLRARKGVTGVDLFAAREVIIGHGANLAGIRLKGVQAGAKNRSTYSGLRLLAGSFSALKQMSWGIVLGRDLAFDLGVFPGDKVTVVLPHGLITPVGFIPRMRRFTVVGIFYAGQTEYDAGLALTRLSDAERLFGLTAPNALALRLKQPFAADALARLLRSQLAPGMQIRTWRDKHRSLFAALANEQRMMFILVALAVLIAAFNILGVLAVLVADKRAEIAVLTGMGFTPRGILAVFVSLGATIGAIGIALGLATGLTIAFNVNAIVEGWGHLIGHPLFSAGAMVLPGLPSRVDPLQVGLIVIVAAVLVMVAAWVPARRAARLPPATALSGE